MLSAVDMTKITLGITVLGWFFSPIIVLLVNKIVPYLGFDASQKLRDLESITIPELKDNLRKVEEQRMLKEARKERSDVDILDMLAGRLKYSLYEAEDILDLIDYHRIEKVVSDCESHDSSWHLRCSLQQELVGAMPTGQCATPRRSTALLPISRAPSVSSVQRIIRCWSGSFDFRNCCRSIIAWLANAIAVARSYRDWTYEEIGITSFQENAVALDSRLPLFARWNLKKRIEMLQNIATEVQKSHLLNLPSNSAPNDIANKNRSRIRSTTLRKVFGREDERDMITKVLRGTPHDDASSSSSSTCFSVIGIYGVAGSGKTTLAQYVRDYEKEAAHFNPIMCVHVSEVFSVDAIFRDMLKEITKNRHSNIEDREDLHAKLEEELRGKRFFLVLDDVWVKNNIDDKNNQELEELLSPLYVGKRGSKILVTSRTKDAARALGAQRLIEISDLNEDQYFSMFMHYALDSTSFDDPEYTQIGREIAKRLHRSPIAAVTVAGQLWRNPDINFWRTTANLDQLNETMGALWWSYQQLDVDVRRCFVYCSIFPRRYEMERDNLVHMWMAQGIVKITNSREDIEDVGQYYFHQLQSCLFLQLKRKIRLEIYSGEYFTVHDLLHDLAGRVAGSEFFRIEKGMVGQIPQDVRHLCIESYGEIELPEQIFQMKNLRTLIMCCSDKKMSKEVFEGVLMRLRKLRVVHVELQRLEPIPACIGQLKHLRYLGIDAPRPHDMTLPAEFTKLYHLQELSVRPDIHLHCSSVEKMTNLINLRCMPTYYGLNFTDVGRLTSLQTLYRFYVRNKRGYEIQQLEHLNNLRGVMYIEHLENVKSKKEARRARLADKEHLTELTLRWGGVDEDRHELPPEEVCSSPPELQEEILEALHPPSRITSLFIRGYGGLRYPSWLSRERCTQEDSRDVPALQLLMFWSCDGSGVPPKIGDFFVHLCKIYVAECSWNSLPENMDRLTSLKELIIQECPNIESLPPLPPYLEEFTLYHCNRSLTESCQTFGHPNWWKLVRITRKTIL